MISRHHRVALLDATGERVLVVDGGLPQYPGRWPGPADLAATAGDPDVWVAGPATREADFAAAWREAHPDVDLDALWAGTAVVEDAFQMVTCEQIYRAQPHVSRWSFSEMVVETVDRCWPGWTPTRA